MYDSNYFGGGLMLKRATSSQIIKSLELHNFINTPQCQIYWVNNNSSGHWSNGCKQFGSWIIWILVGTAVWIIEITVTWHQADYRTSLCIIKLRSLDQCDDTIASLLTFNLLSPLILSKRPCYYHYYLLHIWIVRLFPFVLKWMFYFRKGLSLTSFRFIMEQYKNLLAF